MIKTCKTDIIFELAIVVNLAKSFRPYGQEILD
jgi:hypothetical protein